MPPRLRAVPNAPERAIIYLRQSTYKEESISLELQETACRDYCERLGYQVVGVEADPGITGRTWKRPAVQRTMDAIEQGTADVIVLWKWSRLSRSRKDWALAIDRTDIAGGRIEAATEPIDTATASGRFARGVMTEFSAYQSELIGEVWEDIRQRRLSRGLPASGRLPFGWLWGKDCIEPDPEKAPVVVEMYRRYLAGEGSAALAQWLNTQGIPGPNGKPWTRARPFTVMDSPIHAGLIPYRGSVYPGAHDGIISADTREEYLRERERRRTTGAKPTTSPYLLSQLVRCECGGHMHGKGAVTGGKWYGGYLCGDRLTREHPQRAYVSGLTLEPPIVDWLMTFEPELPPAQRRREALEAAEVARMNHDLEALEAELAAAGRQNVKGILPDTTFMRIRAELEQEMGPLRAAIAAAGRAHSKRPTAEQVASLRGQWVSMTVAEQNRALRLMVEQIRLTRAGAAAEIITTWGDSSVVSL